MTWLLDLFGVLVLFGGIYLNKRKALQFFGAVTVADNPTTRTTDITIGGAGLPATFGAVTVTSITYGADTYGPEPAPLTTTDAAAHTLLVLSPPPGALWDVYVVVSANCGAGNVNAPVGPATYRIGLDVVRIGAAAPVAAPGAGDTSSISAPFCGALSTAGPGLLNFTVSGNSVLIQVSGFAIKEAWTSGHTYAAGDGNTTPGDFVTTGGSVWRCSTSGTASGSAPTGTGTGQGSGAKFDFVCMGSTVPVLWTMGAPRIVAG